MQYLCRQMCTISYFSIKRETCSANIGSLPICVSYLVQVNQDCVLQEVVKTAVSDSPVPTSVLHLVHSTQVIRYTSSPQAISGQSDLVLNLADGQGQPVVPGRLGQSQPIVPGRLAQAQPVFPSRLGQAQHVILALSDRPNLLS